MQYAPGGAVEDTVGNRELSQKKGEIKTLCNSELDTEGGRATA